MSHHSLFVQYYINYTYLFFCRTKKLIHTNIILIVIAYSCTLLHNNQQKNFVIGNYLFYKFFVDSLSLTEMYLILIKIKYS